MGSKLCVVLMFSISLSLAMRAHSHPVDSLYLNHMLQKAKEELWPIDTLNFNTSSLSIHYNHDLTKKVSCIAHFLRSNHDYQCEIRVSMNPTFDTLRSLGLRHGEVSIKDDLRFFGVDLDRIVVTDTIVQHWLPNDIQHSAQRIISVRLSKNSHCSEFIQQLLTTPPKNNKILSKLFEKETSTLKQGRENLQKTPSLQQYHLLSLVKSFYNGFFKEKNKASRPILPASFLVHLGGVSISSSPDEFIPELGYSIAGFTDVFVKPEETFVVSPSIDPPKKNAYLLTNELKWALQAFLGEDFHYQVDSSTNTPFAIIPSGTTKDRLTFLESFLHPQFNYEELGHCNFHTFWKFKWTFESPYTILEIAIDSSSYKAFVTCKNENQERLHIVYELVEGEWKLEGIIDRKGYQKSANSSFIGFYILFLITLVYWCYETFMPKNVILTI